MPNKLKLHIPAGPARPGDTPSFEHAKIPMAGAVRRPPVDVREDAIRDLPYTLIRVLDDDGRALGEWLPKIDAQALHQGLRAMLLTRLFDERMYRLHRQGKTSFYVTSTGEEAIGAAQSLVLDPRDMCFPTYRMLAWLMARNHPLIKLVNQIFSNGDDPLKGRQLPVLYSAREHGFYSLSGNVGSRFGHAVGWAMASAYKGDSRIAVAQVGDGTTAEGDFHEALTFASVYRAPVILCVTNNQWAISTPANVAGNENTTFAARAIGYGIPGLRCDGNDFLAVWATTAWAAERARANLGPTLIELYTYRVAAHSTSDDPSRYRPANEAESWPLGDPIDRLKRHLIRIGAWSEEQHSELASELAEAVSEAVRQGEQVGTHGRSKPPLRAMFEDVFAEPDWRLLEQQREIGA